MGLYPDGVLTIPEESVVEFYDFLIESGNDFEYALQKKLVPILRELAEDEVKRKGAAVCEGCGCWSDLIEDSPDGNWICPDCMDSWHDEHEEE